MQFITSMIETNIKQYKNIPNLNNMLKYRNFGTKINKNFLLICAVFICLNDGNRKTLIFFHTRNSSMARLILFNQIMGEKGFPSISFSIYLHPLIHTHYFFVWYVLTKLIAAIRERECCGAPSKIPLKEKSKKREKYENNKKKNKTSQG